MTITYVIGDATRPVGTGDKIIAHVCNDLNKWGRGFVLAISKRWREPEIVYRASNSHTLGHTMIVNVEPDLWVANMIAQHGIGNHPVDGPPIRYDALEKCLQTVCRVALESKASVHMPKIGCGLGGSSWDLVEPIVQRTICANGVSVTVYDL